MLTAFVFGEVIDQERLTTFLLVWIGFVVFSYDAIRRAKLARWTSRITLDGPASSGAV